MPFVSPKRGTWVLDFMNDFEQPKSPIAFTHRTAESLGARRLVHLLSHRRHKKTAEGQESWPKPYIELMRRTCGCRGILLIDLLSCRWIVASISDSVC